MLVSFSVTNFRSIGEEVTLNMVASNKLTDHGNHLVPIGDTGTFVLRTAIIYGANAAGKSNLIRAMDVAQRLIKDPQERRMQITPFQFQSQDNNTPSSFEFQFLIGKHVFVYGFDINFDKIIAEWLTVDNDVLLFERTEEGTVVVPETGCKQYLGDIKSYTTLTSLIQLPLRNQQLLLNRALSIPEESQGDTLRSIIKWFTTSLIVLPADSRSMEILDRLHNDDKFKSFCANFLNNVGTGVGGFESALQEREISEWEKRYSGQSKHWSRRYSGGDTDVIPKPDSPGSVIVRRLFSKHPIPPTESYYLPFSEESDGTQALAHLLPVLASHPNECRVVVLDELDRSLHPLICWEFVRFFSESCEGAPRQLIVTTHEAHLLNQELLRRDEYWFAEKDDKQQTRLVSLVDFSIRKDLKIERGYLKGRFGAIPLICGMNDLEALLECTEAADAEKEPPA